LRSPMGRRQKFDFLVSNLHWFDGLFMTAIALTLLYLGAASWMGWKAVTFHQRELAFVALVPVALLLDGVLRLHLVLRRSMKIPLRQSILVQGMWCSIKFTNLLAILKCALGFRTPFVRTPKLPGARLA